MVRVWHPQLPFSIPNQEEQADIHADLLGKTSGPILGVSFELDTFEAGPSRKQGLAEGCMLFGGEEAHGANFAVQIDQHLSPSRSCQ